MYKAVTKDEFWTKTKFPAQIITLYLHSYLVFIKLRKMSSGGNKKATKSAPNKNSKESAITMEKIEEMLKQKFKSYDENIKIYLAANNEFLSKRVNELNGKLNDFQASIEVNREKFKELDRNVSHINGTFENRAKTQTIIYTK